MSKEMILSYWKSLQNQDWDYLKKIISPKIIMVWPNTKEKLESISNFIGMYQHAPGYSQINVLSVIASKNIFVSEVFITNQLHVDIVEYFQINLFTFEHKKISLIKEYRLNLDAPAEWREAWMR